MTTRHQRRTQFKPGSNASIHWCVKCNVPLIGSECAVCKTAGRIVDLSPPGDVRFCPSYERGLIHDMLLKHYGIDPLGERVILLNKIGGEDRTEQVIADGLVLGILRYDLKIRDWRFDLHMEGAAVLAQHTMRSTVELSAASGHLSGKTVGPDMIIRCSDGIMKGDEVIVRSGQMVGAGAALVDLPGNAQKNAIKIRKIGKTGARLMDRVSSMTDVIRANEPAIRRLGKDAINTIRGIASQKEYCNLQVFVSFSGGKDSLAVLDLTRSALKRSFGAYFINTGLEFPETVEYAAQFCKKNDIRLHELKAGDAFWQNLPDFGPPAKDYRWCCKICKLSPAGSITAGGKYLAIDGKRKYESFSRARIAPKEENPLVPGQINIYPIRNWRSIEVWLYIFWRGLEYNPLYDQGFERIGCWLCPASHEAEFQRMKAIHADLYNKWRKYMLQWAADHGFPGEYIDHGFWRWRKHPPKMKLLAGQLNIPLKSEKVRTDTFEIKMVSGISPCTAGGYSIEGAVRGINLEDAAETLKTAGDVNISEDLGVIMVRSHEGSIKLFTDGTLQINAPDQEMAHKLFNTADLQLTRAARCTGCEVCLKACPNNAITLKAKKFKLAGKCNRCGICTELCPVIRYRDKM